MAASAFLVTLARKGGMTLKNGNDSVIVWANDATTAKYLASMAMSNDVPVAAWANATATALVTGTEMEGWTYTITLTDPLTPFTVVEVSHTATNGQSVDDIAAALVTALNATSSIANASFSTPNLTIATGSGGDDIGDWTVNITVTPPGTAYSTSLIAYGDTGPVDAVSAGFASSLVHEGSATAALSVALTVFLPALYGVAKVTN